MKGGEMMKKLFLILAILMLGAIMPMVIAETQTQTQEVSVDVAEVTQLTINPPSLDFGSARPTVPKAGQDVTFNAAGSNVDVSVGSSVGQGTVFEYIEFMDLVTGTAISNIKSFSVSLPISSQQSTVGTQITLPTGLVPGIRTGLITYTITSTFCGDDVKNGYEVCDKLDLAGNDCTTIEQGFDGGTLACNTQCGFDTTLCTITPVCTPKTCSELGKQCGSADDGCGTLLECGTCETGQGCSSEGTCVAVCVPDCTNKCEGEANGCDGTCPNPCAENETCNIGVCS
ncbi:MAG: hypothetical protein PHF67_03515 [Candidatus Nanoarchaeia archaeon]|nr:hypothetical protein [Candidatus Nanoarchaeia archaeon]